jgi:hypothetical protein
LVSSLTVAVSNSAVAISSSAVAISRPAVLVFKAAVEKHTVWLRDEAYLGILDAGKDVVTSNVYSPYEYRWKYSCSKMYIPV